MSEDLLDGWKEIASHFNIDTRTAQNWEKEKGLPIHRRGDSKRARVYAYRHELEEWHKTTDAKPGKTRPWLIAAASIAAVLIAVSAWQWTRPGPPATWQVNRTTLEVLAAQGRTCWAKEFPDLSSDEYETYAGSRYGLLADLDGDGHNEMLFSHLPQGIRDTTSGTLLAFDPHGQELWRLPYGTAKQYGDRSFSPYYESRVLLTVKAAGKTYVLLSVSNNWFPSQVLLIDSENGTVVEDYWHPGHISTGNVADLDGDGDDEILLGGSNNPGDGIGHTGIVVLDIPFRDNPRSLPAHFPVEYTGGAASKYLLFPNPDLAEKTHTVPYVQRITAETTGFRVTIELQGYGSIAYQLDHEFNVAGVWPSDGLIAARSKLQLEGHLPPGDITGLDTILTLPATPDANHQAIQEMFKAQPLTAKAK